MKVPEAVIPNYPYTDFRRWNSDWLENQDQDFHDYLKNIPRQQCLPVSRSEMKLIQNVPVHFELHRKPSERHHITHYFKLRLFVLLLTEEQISMQWIIKVFNNGQLKAMSHVEEFRNEYPITLYNNYWSFHPFEEPLEGEIEVLIDKGRQNGV